MFSFFDVLFPPTGVSFLIKLIVYDEVRSIDSTNTNKDDDDDDDDDNHVFEGCLRLCKHHSSG